jgi:hypothetical protein
MKQLKLNIVQFLVIMAFMLPWATTEALETFEQAGVITQLGYAKFSVDNKEYRISSSVKLDSSDITRNKFSDFRKGDVIWFKGRVLGGVNYVDIIVYVTPVSS